MESFFKAVYLKCSDVRCESQVLGLRVGLGIAKFALDRWSGGYLFIVLQKTRTVRVRVPYPHCTGAARTQIVDSMDTNTHRDTQKILKKIFFSKFF